MKATLVAILVIGGGNAWALGPIPNGIYEGKAVCDSTEEGHYEYGISHKFTDNEMLLGFGGGFGSGLIFKINPDSTFSCENVDFPESTSCGGGFTSDSMTWDFGFTDSTRYYHHILKVTPAGLVGVEKEIDRSTNEVISTCNITYHAG